jgi:hypothetical protein
LELNVFQFRYRSYEGAVVFAFQGTVCNSEICKKREIMFWMKSWICIMKIYSKTPLNVYFGTEDMKTTLKRIVHRHNLTHCIIDIEDSKKD